MSSSFSGTKVYPKAYLLFSGTLLEHPQYTRPPVWEGREIPPVLLSGNHAEIAKWRQSEAERLTAERRPDLWARHLAGKG